MRRQMRRLQMIAGPVACLLLVALLEVRAPAEGDTRSQSTLLDAIPQQRVVPAGAALVTYRITGETARAGSLTFVNADGVIEQRRDAPIAPVWTEQFRASSGAFVYVSVQNGNTSGSVTCEIYIEDEPYKQVTAAGVFALASCNGSVP